MSAIEIELTDPSKELTTLGDIFTKASGGNNTIEGLARCINISVDDPEFLEILAAIQRRIRDVEELAKVAGDADFDQEMRNDVLAAIRSFSQIVHPKNAHIGWDQIRSSHLTAKNITALRFFSQTARRYRPLRVVPLKTREEILGKISDAIAEIENDTNLEHWRKTILVGGLRRIQLVIKHLPFFGHDAAIAELWNVHQKLSLVINDIEATGRKSSTLKHALLALSLVGSLFVLPADAASALNHYKAWMVTWSNEVLRIVTDTNRATETKLLPPPASSQSICSVP
jgi:hypothetical protein